MCQKSVTGMPYRALVQNKQETVDFNKPAKCFSDRGDVDVGCDAPFVTGKVNSIRKVLLYTVYTARYFLVKVREQVSVLPGMIRKMS